MSFVLFEWLILAISDLLYFDMNCLLLADKVKLHPSHVLFMGQADQIHDNHDNHDNHDSKRAVSEGRFDVLRARLLFPS
jgi:hypothetical protein